MFSGNIVRSIGYRLFLDDADFNKQLDNSSKQVDTFSTRVDKAGKRLQTVGKRLTTAVTLPIVGLGTAAVTQASKYEEALAKFNTVFRDQSEEVLAWAEVNAEALNRSSADWVEYLGSFQDTFVPLGFARDEAAELSKQLVTLGEDLASFNDMRVEDVMSALQSSIVGNTENLRQFGVVAQESQIQQEAVAAGLVESVDAYKQLEGQQRSLVRSQSIYNLILKGTEDAQGDALRTADSFANQMKGLQASAKELAIEFGENMLPALTRIVSNIGELIDGFGDLTEEQQDMIIKLGAFAAAAGPAIAAIGGITKALGTMKTVMSGPSGVIALLVATGVALYRIHQRGQEIQQDKSFERLGDAMSRMSNEALSTVENIEEFANAYGLSTDAAIEIARRQGLITEDLEEQLELLRQQNAERDESLGPLDDQLDRIKLIEDAIERLSSVDGGFSLLTPQEQEKETIRQMNELVSTLVTQFDMSLDGALQVALATDALNESQRSILSTMLEQQQSGENLTTQQRIQQEIQRQLTQQREQQADASEEEATARERQNDAIEEAIRLERERVEGVIEGRKEATEIYEAELARISRAVTAGRVDERQAEEERLNAAETFANALIRLGYDGQLIEKTWTNTAGEIVTGITEGDKQLDAMSGTIEQLTLGIEARRQAEERANEELARQQEIVDANISAYERWRDQRVSFIEDDVERLEAQRDIELQAAQRRGEDTYHIEKYWQDQIDRAKEDARREDLQQQERYNQAALNSLKEMYSSIQSVVSSYYDYKNAILDQQLQEELERNGLGSQTRSESLQSELEELEAKIAAETDAEKKAELEKEKIKLKEEIAKEKIEEKYAKKKAKLQQEQARMEKAFRIFDIMINTATAVTKALTAGPIIGPILAATIAGLGAAQLALVASTPIPEFAEGGVVTGDTIARIGEAGDKEAVIPLRPDVLSDIGEGIAEASGQVVNNNNTEENTQVIQINIGEDTIYEMVQRGLENRQIRV